MFTTPTKLKEKKRWYQFSLRTLLLFVTFTAILCSWLGVKIKQARKQREAAEALQKLGMVVLYDYQQNAFMQNDPNPQSSMPSWLKNLLGEDIFINVIDVGVRDDKPNHITDAGLVHVKALFKVEYLSLWNTQITDSGLEHIKCLSLLNSLNLSHTHISDKGLQNLQRLVQLQILWLDGTQITDAGLEHLMELTNLQELYLSKTSITDAGLKHIKGLSKLHYLILDDSKVTDSGLQYLEGLRHLEVLELRNTSVTEYGIMKLKKVLPNCSISFGNEEM